MEKTDTLKILYVDDELMNLFLFENLLAKDFEVLTANSAEKGLQILQDEKGVKVVISDMKMPKMNGIQFIKAAKEFHNHCPYLILSGYNKGEEIEEALETELIMDYLQKPYEVRDITKSIRKAVENFNQK